MGLGQKRVAAAGQRIGTLNIVKATPGINPWTQKPGYSGALKNKPMWLWQDSDSGEAGVVWSASSPSTKKKVWVAQLTYNESDPCEVSDEIRNVGAQMGWDRPQAIFALLSWFKETVNMYVPDKA